MYDSHRQRQPSAADVTSEEIFHQRRTVMKALNITAASLSLPLSAQADVLDWLTGGKKKADSTATHAAHLHTGIQCASVTHADARGQGYRL
ncbi:MAG: hypothetical protein ACR5LF_10180 [Symbiopectobacterium sp.]